MPDLRDLPILPVPYSHHAALSHVRDFLERATDSSPYGAVDQETYMTVLRWCEQADKRAIVQQVLSARLGLGGPPADKAIILSQTLNASYLEPLLAGLKTQMENAHPFLAAIATQQHTSGQGHRDSQAESSTTASDLFKWDTWTETCGKSQAPWRPAPKQEDMGWGWWVAQDIGVDEWWTVPKAEAKDPCFIQVQVP